MHKMLVLKTAICTKLRLLQVVLISAMQLYLTSWSLQNLSNLKKAKFARSCLILYGSLTAAGIRIVFIVCFRCSWPQEQEQETFTRKLHDLTTNLRNLRKFMVGLRRIQVTAWCKIHERVSRVVNIAILKVLQYYWQYFFGYCLHVANTFKI